MRRLCVNERDSIPSIIPRACVEVLKGKKKIWWAKGIDRRSFWLGAQQTRERLEDRGTRLMR